MRKYCRIKKLVDEAVDFSQVHKRITLEDFVEYLDMTLKRRYSN